ncbi:hypothetical protein GCM10020254_63960 [Streptomyces goshikiensis]
MVSRIPATISSSLVRSTRTPEGVRGVVAHLHHPQGPALAEDQREEYGAGRQQRPHLPPVPAGQRSGQPDHRPGGLDELGLRQEVLDHRDEHRGGADADEHQPVAVDAPLVREQVHGEAGDQAADQGPERHLGGAALEHDDDDERAHRRPVPEAEQVRGAERVARDGLEDGAGHPERGADQQRDQDARQPQVVDDEVVGGGAVAQQGLHDVRRGYLEVAGPDEYDGQRERRDGEQQPDGERAPFQTQGDPAGDPQRPGPGGPARPEFRGHGHSWAILLRRTR